MDDAAQRCLKANGLDFTTVPKRNKYNTFGEFEEGQSVQDYACYPNTKVYLGVSISREAVRYHDEPYILVKYKFYTPSTFKKLNEKEFDEMIIDAILTDTSLDFDPPNVRKKKSLIEKEQEEKEKKERYKKYQIQYYLKELRILFKRKLVLNNTTVSTTGLSQRELNILINKNTMEIRQAVSNLKELGDKTHKSLFPSTDSIF
jgi:hypothetical protein